LLLFSFLKSHSVKEGGREPHSIIVGGRPLSREQERINTSVIAVSLSVL